MCGRCPPGRPGRAAGAVDLAASELDAARGRPDHARQQVEQRGLAGAVGPDDAVDATRGQVQRVVGTGRPGRRTACSAHARGGAAVAVSAGPSSGVDAACRVGRGHVSGAAPPSPPTSHEAWRWRDRHAPPVPCWRLWHSVRTRVNAPGRGLRRAGDRGSSRAPGHRCWPTDRPRPGSPRSGHPAPRASCWRVTDRDRHRRRRRWVPGSRTGRHPARAAPAGHRPAR